MYSYLRKKVSGKRNRMEKDGYDLDLTEITPRILAMSFPAASKIQKMYRNDIKDVANYLKEQYGNNYYVYNMSGREYDTEPFDGQVETA